MKKRTKLISSIQEKEPNAKKNIARARRQILEILDISDLEFDEVYELYMRKRKKLPLHVKDKQSRYKMYDTGTNILTDTNRVRTHSSLRVALFLLSKLDWNGTIEGLSLSDIGENLGMKPQNVFKAIKELCSETDDKGNQIAPIFTKTRLKNGNRYVVNDDIAWKGWIDNKPSLQAEKTLLN